MGTFYVNRQLSCQGVSGSWGHLSPGAEWNPQRNALPYSQLVV
jgi:hypothetical protein